MPGVTSAAPPRPTWRTATTLRAYGMLGALGFALVGLGAVLPVLQSELGVSPGLLAGLPTLFALWFVAVGLVGGAVLRRVGHARMLALAGALIVAGAGLAALPAPQTVVGGLAVIGLGGALVVVAVPAALAGEHPDRLRRALTEANALSVLAGMAAPPAVSIAVSSGLGWRVGHLAPMALLATLGFGGWRASPPSLGRTDTAASPARAFGAASGGAAPAGAAPARATYGGAAPPAAPVVPAPHGKIPVLRAWLGVVLAVMVEFAFTLWSGVAIREWHATTAATAALGPLFFVSGMAVGRLVSAAADRHASPRRLAAAAALLIVGGFAGFSAATTVGAAFAWLVVAGLGVAPLYPQTLTQLIGAASTPDAGSRWGAVASGTAITVSPQILGRVADGVGLRWAYVLVPVLVVLLVIQQLVQDRSTRRHTAAGH